MDRYWEANAITTAPPVPPGTSGTYPTDGNPATVTPPTTPGAWWYHSITEEIRNAIVKLGGSPNFTQVDQLANAIVASISSAISGVTTQLAKVAYSGSYTDLNNKPSIPAAQVNSDWNASSGVAAILNKPAIPPAIGFTPVQQGGGNSQGANKVYIGWDGGGLRATVDSTDEGRFVFETELQGDVNNLQGQINNVQGQVNNINANMPNVPPGFSPDTIGGIGCAFLVEQGPTGPIGATINGISWPNGGGVTYPGTWQSHGGGQTSNNNWYLWVRIA